jgi:hypothetical protein
MLSVMARQLNSTLSVPTFLLMKSHARSFRVFSPSVLAAAVTVSRTSPNWKMNVTSGPSIFFPTADSLLRIDVPYLKKTSVTQRYTQITTTAELLY